jgi:transposase-like protein
MTKMKRDFTSEFKREAVALGFKSFTSASQTLSGNEAMAMIRKAQVISVAANDMGAQRDFVATLFSLRLT